MKIIQLFSIVALLQGSTSSAAEVYPPVEIINDASTQAYPPVEIINTTPFHAKGTMKFAACSNDNYRKVRVCIVSLLCHLIVFTSHHMH